MRVLPSFIVATVLAAVVSYTASADHLSEKSIKARTAPVGKVYKEGDEIAGASTNAGGSARTGADIYKQFCTVCHAAGVAGAPKTGDKAQWAPLVDRGLADITASAIKGKGAMPPKGTCMDCSDEEIEMTVAYMLEAVQ